jgi:hypothetical protein
MAIEIFNRYETKYLVDATAYTELERRLGARMEPDAYNRQRETYPITNLYYDTGDNTLIRASLAKPRYREKLRLRAYGVPTAGATVYLEIKKKCNGLVNKRRSALHLEEAYTFLDSGNAPAPRPTVNAQVLREIARITGQAALKPTLYISYDRRAYVGTEQRDLRISFDSNILTRRYDVRLEAGVFGRPLLTGDAGPPDTGRRLMEIKVERTIPLWLCRLLSEYRIYPVSFSKYGTEYTRMLAGLRAGGV